MLSHIATSSSKYCAAVLKIARMSLRFASAGPDRIPATRQRNITVETKIHDDLGFALKSMNVPRNVILRVCDKQHTLKSP